MTFRKTWNRLTLATGVLAATSLAVPAWAVPGVSDNLNVSASVSANCTITANGLSFGDYDPIVTNASAHLEQTGTLSVTCTNQSAATITLDQGANPDTGSTAIAPLRRMKDTGTSYLSYKLYSDASRTVVWGDDASVDVDYTGTGSSENVTIYGRVDSGQTSAIVGSYTDTVVATITF